jgi:hypothetical protein
MKLRIGAICTLFFVLILTGCGANSVNEVLENDILHLEILKEAKTEYGNVVFYKTDSPSETYGARLLKKNGLKWDILLGSQIPAIEESEDIAWGWQSSKDEPAFIYGIIKNNKIKKLTINDSAAIIVKMERGYNLFYLLTQEIPLSNQKNGENGTQIKGYSDKGELIYQRLNFN